MKRKIADEEKEDGRIGRMNQTYQNEMKALIVAIEREGEEGRGERESQREEVRKRPRW